MSKIVCDVCGSTYSETEAQCPICGTAKSEAAKPVVETNAEDQAAKGGKFSRSNNRRNGTGSTRRSGAEKNKEEGNPSNVAMIIIVAVLLLAIVSVCVFIAVRLINRPNQPDPNDSTPPVVQTIPCTGIELVGNPDSTLTFTDLTQTAQLTVMALPENTTDTVTYTYTSSDPAVITVDNTGLVTPVAEGTATVTIAYGSYTISVSVTCDLPDPVVELKLKHTEITLSNAVGNQLTANLYDGELDPTAITWTSSNTAIVLVENGVVTGVADGTATVTATYGQQTVSCKIIVRMSSEEATYVVGSKWSNEDISLTVGETQEIDLRNKATGEKITENVQWSYSNDFPKCCKMEETETGVKITATADTSTLDDNHVRLYAVYEGKTYTLIIRIKPAAEG